MEAELLAPSIDELCKRKPQQDEEEEEEVESSYHSYLENQIQNLIKDSKDRNKGWVTRANVDNTEVSFKKVRIYYICDQYLYECLLLRPITLDYYCFLLFTLIDII